MIDGTSSGAASGGYHGVDPGCGTVKGEDATIKVLTEHPFYLCKQSVPSSTERQNLNTVQQLGFADCG